MSILLLVSYKLGVDYVTELDMRAQFNKGAAGNAPCHIILKKLVTYRSCILFHYLIVEYEE